MLQLPKLLRRYIEYRRVGYGRLAALRFAWLVAAGTAGTQSIR